MMDEKQARYDHLMAMIRPAERLCEAVHEIIPQSLDVEITPFSDGSVAVVLEIEGIDYQVTMMPLPSQRERKVIN
ncbi:hypothetical protein [Pelagibacterium sp. H642]|uniref:hypothetical protein n=1 Tax=Pelagibacterium sp. H642 TaxID=1881069 RepID=UPI002816610F|nr:hypothetical protein [Pelagibacterium sp. H642]WMT90129.1 hypothetical protein NO934_15220 [Pelagibacterium sp. H642]